MLNAVQGNVMRFLPSFLLQREHVDIAMEHLRRLLHVPGAEVVQHVEQLAAAGV
jgi:acetylornithine/succinyldiaminopimelate/putrescine aminotransferase